MINRLTSLAFHGLSFGTLAITVMFSGTPSEEAADESGSVSGTGWSRDSERIPVTAWLLYEVTRRRDDPER